MAYRYAERPKSELYLELLPLLTRGALELPDDPETVKEMKPLERRRGAPGKDIIDHPPSGASNAPTTGPTSERTKRPSRRIRA